MAIKVTGNTVITDSRELNNITGVDATTANIIVTLTDTQTLTNKTIDNPNITGAISGDARANQGDAEAGTNNDQIMTPLRTAQAIVALAPDPATLSAGGVGTYCFAKATTDVSFGSTIAGSNLQPTSAIRTIGSSGGGFNALEPTAGSALSGTWRCMGTYDSIYTVGTGGEGTTTTAYGITLWLRIS